VTRVPDWLDVTIRAEAVEKSQVGRITCPVHFLCPKPPADQPELSPFIAVSATAKTLLSDLLSGVDIATVLRTVAMPPPSNLIVKVESKSRIGVGVSVDDSVSVAGAFIRPFTLTNTPDQSEANKVTVDLYLNSGTAELHSVTSKLPLNLPIGEQVNFEQPGLSQPPVNIQLQPPPVSNNLLSNFICGLVFEVSLADLVGKKNQPAQKTASQNDSKQEIVPQVSIDKVTENSLSALVKLARLIPLPPGINMDLGTISVSLGHRTNPDILRVSLDGNFSGGTVEAHDLVLHAAINDGAALGNLIGDLASDMVVPLSVTVAVGETNAILDMEYKPKESLPFLVARLILLEKMRVAGAISSQTTASDTKKVKKDKNAKKTKEEKEAKQAEKKVSILKRPLIPDLPVEFDPVLTIVKRLLRAVYTCINQEEALFKLVTMFRVKPEVLPPFLKDLRVGLVAARISGLLGQTHTYYDPERTIGSKGNTIFVGPSVCVPADKTQEASDARIMGCASRSPVMVISSEKQSTEKKQRKQTKSLKALHEVTKLTDSLGLSTGIELLTGPEEPISGPCLAISTTLSYSRHLIDAVVNEGGICVRSREGVDGGGFVAVAVGSEAANNQNMVIKVPLKRFELPVPIEDFSDPCGLFQTCSLPTKPATLNASDRNVTLTSDTVESSQATTRIIVDPLSSWQVDFTMTHSRLQNASKKKAGKKIQPAIALTLATPTKDAVFSVNFLPHYRDPDMTRVKKWISRIPYLESSEQLIKMMASSLTDKDKSGQYSPNAIKLRLNDQPLFLPGTKVKATKVNGVFPPTATDIAVSIKYSAFDKLLTIECSDSNSKHNDVLYRTVFPVDIGSMFSKSSELLQVGFGAQRGSRKSRFAFALSNVTSSTSSINADLADLLLPTGHVPQAGKLCPLHIRLRDECGRPQFLGKLGLAVRIVSEVHGVVVREGASLNVNGIFRFEFEAPHPGQYLVEICPDGGRWTALAGKEIHVRGPW
jgi:hypothetical protein